MCVLVRVFVCVCLCVGICFVCACMVVLVVVVLICVLCVCLLAVSFLLVWLSACVAFCLHLCSLLPQATWPRLAISLSDSRCPLLLLLEALKAAGWVMVSGPVQHFDGNAKSFDSRKITSKHAYLRCLLEWTRLLDARPQVPERDKLVMPSTECSAYYELMLVRPWLARSAAVVGAVM
jgi:hypothetical protein